MAQFSREALCSGAVSVGIYEHVRCNCLHSGSTSQINLFLLGAYARALMRSFVDISFVNHRSFIVLLKRLAGSTNSRSSVELNRG